MYKIIIADDEHWVAYKLTHLVDWAALGFEVIETVEDGLAAYKACMEKKPDVLLTDIRMPGMDGLELTDALRRDLSGLQVVLISGYAEFAYAQRAVKLGAFDYLVKPVSREQVEELLARLQMKLADQHRQLDTYFSLLDNDRSMTVAQWLAERQPEERYGCFQFCTFEIEPGQYPELLYEHMEKDYCQVIIRTGKTKASVLLGGVDEKSFSQWERPEGHLGYSEKAQGQALFESLYRHSDQAFQTARFLNAPAPVEYVKGHDKTYISQLVLDVQKALGQKEYSQCDKLLAALQREMEKMMLSQIEANLSRIYRAFALNSLLPPIETEMADERYFSTSYGSLTDVFTFFSDSMVQQEQTGEFPLGMITKYIDEHFTKELLVSELAKRFHFSAGYFSSMFSKGMDQTVIKYISDKRMSYAKKLLRETELGISDVADRSGYGDYFQFTKAFKRITGVTPGQYRKNSQDE